MKRKKFIGNIAVSAFIVFFCICNNLYADSVITNPPPNSMIENRLDFPVSGSIDGYSTNRASNLHYWVTIANVGTDNNPHLHWPKFYIKSANFRGRVSDGGQNPLPEPQVMMIVLLRVDDTTNQRFIRWLKNGSNTGSYPGIPIRTSEMEITVPIRFP